MRKNDPGADALNGSLYAPDAFGTMLGYFQDDYKRTFAQNGVSVQSPFNANPGTNPAWYLTPTGSAGQNLYNGNIASWMTNIMPSGTGGVLYETLTGEL